MAGTVGAIFNGALQLGSAVGIAAVSSIETSIEQKLNSKTVYTGRAAAFWFLLGIIGVEIISVLVFYKVEVEHRGERADEESSVGEKVPHLDSAMASRDFSEKEAPKVAVQEELRSTAPSVVGDAESIRKSEDIHVEAVKQE